MHGRRHWQRCPRASLTVLAQLQSQDADPFGTQRASASAARAVTQIPLPPSRSNHLRLAVEIHDPICSWSHRGLMAWPLL